MARGFMEYTPLLTVEFGRDHLFDHQTKLLLLALKFNRKRFQITIETNTFVKNPYFRVYLEYMVIEIKVKNKTLMQKPNILSKIFKKSFPFC